MRAGDSRIEHDFDTFEGSFLDADWQAGYRNLRMTGFLERGNLMSLPRVSCA